jgi:PadR family transcriptional regulator, regulatory protein PadR
MRVAAAVTSGGWTSNTTYVDLSVMTRIRRSSGQTLNLLRGLMDEPRKWHHGYELSKATQLLSGTLYPILMRLSDRGFLEHKWLDSEEAGRPPRHVYRLTAKGVAYAKEQFELADEVGAAPARSVSRA